MAGHGQMHFAVRMFLSSDEAFLQLAGERNLRKHLQNYTDEANCMILKELIFEHLAIRKKDDTLKEACTSFLHFSKICCNETLTSII
jgi:hypothetical protein